MRRLLFLLAVALPACLNAQAVDTTGWTHDSTVIGWQHTDSVPSAWAYTDSAAVWRQDSTPVLDTIVAPPPPPVAGTHEPTGFRPLVIQSLASLAGTGPVGLQSSGGQFAFVTDPQRGTVMECTYRGAVGGHPACTLWASSAGITAAKVTRLYLRIWVQPSLGFVGHSSSVNKLLYVGFGPNGNQYILDMSGVGQAGLRARIALQNTNGMPVAPGTPGWNGASCGGAGCSWSKPASGPQIPRGQWSMLEALLVSAPAGSKASSVTLWVNGQSAGSATGFDFNFPAINGSGITATKATLSTYWGGGAQTVVTPFTVRLSDWYVSGAP